MSKQLLEQKFVPYTKGFKVSVAFLGLLVIASALVFLPIALMWAVMFAIIMAIFSHIRKNQILRVFDDRVEVRSKFLVENVRRIEASKIEAVNVTDALLGQKGYGAVIITGSGGSKVMVTPIADQERVAELVRSISSAPSVKPHASTQTPVESGDLAAQLKNLAELHNSGVLDDEEYKAAKAKLIK